MELGCIYKYTNLINGKVYIGQTKQALEQRDYKHLSQLNDNTYFHRALVKYGRENFSLEIIEDNIPLKKLDEKEKYYIDYFDSYYVTGKGYNLTQGGQWGSSHQKLTLSDAKEIKNLILCNKNLTFQKIADKFGVTIYAISDINRGKTFYDKNLTYPLRPAPTKSIIDEDKLSLILDMILNTNMSYKEIALATDVNEYTVGEISRGTSSWCPPDLTYPLRKPVQSNTYQNKINQEQVKEICYKLCFTNIPIEEISKEYNIAKNTVSDISRGVSWKSITNQFVCPIRKNKLKNQEIYNLIYGIV